ncbi:MAG TPA: trimethylamine methyltransferase family protein [Bacteroidales bacterium]|nr:trimethylamine methyltransferase family protein [Bacteroidales bacterium]
MLQILSSQEKKIIHQTARQILTETGIRVRSKTIYELLLSEGGKPDISDTLRVYLPEKLLDEKMALCPRQFKIRNRLGEENLIKSTGDSLYFTANATQYVRGTSKKAVEVGVNEFTDFVRVADKLENVHGIVGTSLKEYPPNCRDFAGFRLAAQHSYKHLRPCIYTPSGAEAIIEMADIILDGKSLKDNMFFTLGYSIVSPLTWTETALDLFYLTRGYGIPVMINSEPLAGGTSPVTLAGCLALADAEVISGIVINQIIEPGRPCIYNSGFAHVFDMMTTLVLTGSPENALLQAAGAEMAQYHGLPSAAWALSDSVMLDSQASFEKLLTAFAHTLGNVSIVWGIGNIETSKTISPEIAVIDNEIAGNCKRFKDRFKVDEEHLALGLIQNHAFDGSFLESMHTLEHFQEEIRYSGLLNRSNRGMWQRGGSISLEERAEKKVNEILGRKPEYYLSGRQMDKLELIEKQWNKRINGT